MLVQLINSSTNEFILTLVNYIVRNFSFMCQRFIKVELTCLFWLDDL